MSIIFCFSEDRGSEEHTSRILVPVLRWLKPDMADASVHQIQFAVRKGGHLTEYAILAALVGRALCRPRADAARPWSWKPAGLALLVAAAYAATDEFHQSFVPSRDASLLDVLLDTVGGGIGLALAGAIRHWRKRR